MYGVPMYRVGNMLVDLSGVALQSPDRTLHAMSHPQC